ncbi:unnamed protein product [Effrenium voratum]|nr:unnamed protein product [Effrenium voratum]
MPRRPPEVPPEDEWSEEAKETYWWGNWRDPAQCLFPWLYENGLPRHQYPMKDDWCVEPFPVEYNSQWASGRQSWEVYLDAYDAWLRESSRLVEVYKRKVEDMDYEESREVYEGKFPDVPEYPPANAKVLQAAAEPDVVALAEALEDPDSDANCKDCALWTPLMYAAMAGSLECVEYLVDQGANVDELNAQQDTAYDIAIQNYAAKQPDHPVLYFFRQVKGARGHGWRSRLPIGASQKRPLAVCVDPPARRKVAKELNSSLGFRHAVVVDSSIKADEAGAAWTEKVQLAGEAALCEFSVPKTSKQSSEDLAARWAPLRFRCHAWQALENSTVPWSYQS